MNNLTKARKMSLTKRNNLGTQMSQEAMPPGSFSLSFQRNLLQYNVLNGLSRKPLQHPKGCHLERSREISIFIFCGRTVNMRYEKPKAEVIHFSQPGFFADSWNYIWQNIQWGVIRCDSVVDGNWTGQYKCHSVYAKDFSRPNVPPDYYNNITFDCSTYICSSYR